jgi:hypothetical protein
VKVRKSHEIPQQFRVPWASPADPGCHREPGGFSMAAAVCGGFRIVVTIGGALDVVEEFSPE